MAVFSVAALLLARPMSIVVGQRGLAVSLDGTEEENTPPKAIGLLTAALVLYGRVAIRCTAAVYRKQGNHCSSFMFEGL